MKKLALLFAIMGLVFIEVNAQGLKDIELGDYGLTAPLWGKGKIETTLLGYKGTLNVEKYNNKIYSIAFVFNNNRDFTLEMADNLAKSLMKKYTNIKFSRLGNCNWIQSELLTNWTQHELSDEKKVRVFVIPGYYCSSNEPMEGGGTAKVEIQDYEILKKIVEGEEKIDNSDF